MPAVIVRCAEFIRSANPGRPPQGFRRGWLYLPLWPLVGLQKRGQIYFLKKRGLKKRGQIYFSSQRPISLGVLCARLGLVVFIVLPALRRNWEVAFETR